MGSSPLDAWITNDEEITSLLAQDWDRQTTTMQLIASENFASPVGARRDGIDPHQ